MVADGAFLGLAGSMGVGTNQEVLPFWVVFAKDFYGAGVVLIFSPFAFDRMHDVSSGGNNEVDFFLPLRSPKEDPTHGEA